MTALVREGRLFRVSGFDPSHRQLFLISEATLVDRTTTRVEVSIGHVDLMFLRSLYRNGLHVRRATAAEFAVLSERHGIPAASAEYTWILDPEGESFVVASNPNWREAEYALMGDRESLYDGPWPPEFPAESGNVS
ncbi:MULTISPECIES: hypothetical protein [Streptomyces]|uniref:Uncharacterized protein n=1 Tax=Streptomyces venezuelae (strain ATCC 10712 / CBS 650.69 / DSM 40230 / JCM 4526 / NBRC 13096 / PD 04745) TaxID=953739 RepID=F2RH25_STRVP|nr:hypothetical protein [Streptomyces venezuelae]APE26377.1 hypothetical protein vnz_20080 [Streptomyces venezuelae]QES03755.1 hypothetical protein DEJ43_20370 [Streptomyces venezuelae ATCC 10712]QES10712.1 hypothetical protein DEJ44_19330 [Streptomyces venezuelae]QES17372.1 hypothetical protein DEJ45_16065 [Streptomyces venezuelae]CCA57353.1 hypothetical protein SVEN_4067 [Streptomyces venezuelae ATCC 10712]